MLGNNMDDGCTEVSVKPLRKSACGRNFGSLGSRVVSSPRIKPRRQENDGAASSRTREVLPGIPVPGSPKPRGSSHRSPLRCSEASPLSSPRQGRTSTASARHSSSRTSSGFSRSPSPASSKAPHRLHPLTASPIASPPDTPERGKRGTRQNRYLHAPQFAPPHRRSNSDGGEDRPKGRQSLVASGSSRRSSMPGPSGSMSRRSRTVDDSAVAASTVSKHKAVDRDALRTTSMPPSKFFGIRDSVHIQKARAREPPHEDVDSGAPRGGSGRSASDPVRGEGAPATMPVHAISDPGPPRKAVKKLVCFEQPQGIVYPNSSRVSSVRVIKANTAKSRRSNTHAQGRGSLTKARAPPSHPSRPESTESESTVTDMTARVIALGKDSGHTTELEEAGFTLTHCDDPHQRFGDPKEAAENAREMALELRRELDEDEGRPGGRP